MAFDTSGALIDYITAATNIQAATTIPMNMPMPFCSIHRSGGSRPQVKGDAPIYVITVWDESELKAWQSFSAVRDALFAIRASVPQIGHVGEQGVHNGSDGNESHWYAATYDFFIPCN